MAIRPQNNWIFGQLHNWDQIKQLLGRVSELEGQLVQMQQFVINSQNNSIVGPNGIENASSDYRTLPSNPTVLFRPK